MPSLVKANLLAIIVHVGSSSSKIWSGLLGIAKFGTGLGKKAGSACGQADQVTVLE